MMKRVVNFGIATAFTTFVVLYIVKHSVTIPYKTFIQP